MSRRPVSYVVTMDGIGVSKPSTTRAKALRSRGWWNRRLGADLDLTRTR